MTENTAICTIIAKNYLAGARALAESFRRYHPGIPVIVLVIDEAQGFFDPLQESFETLSLDALPIPDRRRFCFQYDVTELATAVKPWLMEYLLTVRHFDKVIYFDPDIYFTGNIEEAVRLLDQHDVILTPHLDQDYPEDGKHPDDRHILLSGIFNLGFLGARSSERALALLRWLQGKLVRKCVIDRSGGYFVDQRFFDLAFSFSEAIGVLRSVAYNTAYWNLHSRRVSKTENAWQVNGMPLTFFHFSAYRPDKPDTISRHQNRFTLEERQDLAPLFDEYRDLLMRNGYDQCSQWPYSYGCFCDGQTIPYSVRKHLRNTAHVNDRELDPFASARLSWMAWLTQHVWTEDIAMAMLASVRWNEIAGLPDVNKALLAYEISRNTLNESERQRGAAHEDLSKVEDQIFLRLVAAMERASGAHREGCCRALWLMARRKPHMLLKATFWRYVFFTALGSKGLQRFRACRTDAQGARQTATKPPTS